MYTIQIRVQCSEKFTEVPSDNLEQAELAVESLISRALLELFDSVNVEDCNIQISLENRSQHEDACG